LRTIDHDGITYTCPLSDRFRRHTPAELAMMTESVREHGIQNPVRTYHDTTLDVSACVLDGEGRLEAAVATGTEVPILPMGPLTTDEAYALAVVFNDHRRQDTPEAVQQRRRERIERVAAARAGGKSTRQIADAEGVSQSQVVADLKTATEQGCSVETPEKVVGKDGKSRPATQPAKPKRTDFEFGANTNGTHPPTEPEPEAEEATGDEDEPAGPDHAPDSQASPPSDPSEETPEAPAHPADASVAKVNELCHRLDKIKGDVEALSSDPWAGFIHVESVAYTISTARKALWQGRPTEPCKAGAGVNGSDRTTAARVLKGGRK
jgi:hypothetical protein